MLLVVTCQVILNYKTDRKTNKQKKKLQMNDQSSDVWLILNCLKLQQNIYENAFVW